MAISTHPLAAAPVVKPRNPAEFGDFALISRIFLA
jgi:hypothetical protein